MQPLLFHLREATAASHEMLDADFGSLALATRDGYARFLSGHAIGLAPLFESFRTFVEGELAMECPDYPAMLRADLAALGVDSEALPALDRPSALSPTAIGYVIAGSRLGLAAISRNGYWGREHALPSAYMEDGLGLAVWKEAAAKLKQIVPDEAQAARESAAAVAAFDTFRAAFAASGAAPA
jgi:heme oxygenase